MRDEELRERFDKVDARFDKVDARFEKIDARFEEILRAIVQTNEETRRILALEIINTREDLGARIDAVDQKLEAFRDETDSNFDDVYSRLDRLETEYSAMRAGLRRVEKRFSEDA